MGGLWINNIVPSLNEEVDIDIAAVFIVIVLWSYMQKLTHTSKGAYMHWDKHMHIKGCTLKCTFNCKALIELNQLITVGFCHFKSTRISVFFIKTSIHSQICTSHVFTTIYKLVSLGQERNEIFNAPVTLGKKEWK